MVSHFANRLPATVHSIIRPITICRSISSSRAAHGTGKWIDKKSSGELGSIARGRTIDNDLTIKIDFRRCGRRSRDRDLLPDCGVVHRDADRRRHRFRCERRP